MNQPHAVSTFVQPVALARRTRATSTAVLADPATCAQGALALHYLAEGSPPAGIASRSRAVARQRRPADPLEAWAASFVQAVVEVVAGDRPLSQLVRWTSRRVYADVADRQRLGPEPVIAPTSRTSARRQQVASLRVYRPGPDVAEVSARVTSGSRSRAVAARLDRVRGRWMCTAIDFG